ncbi:NUDIX hydrolase [Candidatus Woesearchaeota archaeon]|nr:NUDIX hydrolase [Candidatus Woesearchaeota archaeon]
MTQKHRPQNHLTTDIIYHHNSTPGIVLITRKNPPYGIAIPGGFLEEDVTLAENAMKELQEETGIVALITKKNLFNIYDTPNRDPRGRMVSHVYAIEGNALPTAGDDAATARVYSIAEIVSSLQQNKFAFDHEKILCDYLKEKRYLKQM